MHRQFDLIAIGGGSGGLAVAERAAQYGRSVAIVEGGSLGGTCVNSGCVPKKVMWYAANLAHAVDDANDFGIEVRRGKTDWGRLISARDRYIADINAYWNEYVGTSGITHIRGHARFVDRRTVEVNGAAYSADHIVIATGSRPLVPALPGAELGITSDGFFALTEQPRRVAIIGGGYIGVELAGMLRALGSSVTLATLNDRILERFDPMISDSLSGEMRAQGIALHLSLNVTALEQTEAGIAIVSSTGERLTGYDRVIWAVGRTPNVGSLDLEAAGLTTQTTAAIATDASQNTNVEGVYAIGDVTGRAPLTPVAIAAGRRLADRLFGGQTGARVDYEQVPSVVFSHPPAATVGLSEPEARERHGKVTLYQSSFTPMRHALSRRGVKTDMKLVCAGAEQRVVGVHLVGDNVDEMLQGFAVAVRVGATKEDLDRTIPIHPTSAEELVTMHTPRQDPRDRDLEWRKSA
jgi:glutathione reductase (NADPH)